MELEAIQQLIKTDEETRKRVNDVYQKRSDLKQAIADEKQKLHDAAWDEVKQKVTDTKKQLDAKIEQDEKDNATYYKTAFEKLQSMYDGNKEKWKKDLVQRIISIEE